MRQNPGKISIHALLAESDFSAETDITQPSNFYPRSPCGERLHFDNFNLHCVEISIHALLAESDNRYGRPIDVQLVFLSTLSLRRATSIIDIINNVIDDFYPRSPCGERPTKSDQGANSHEISIHALLAESDAFLTFLQIRVALFLSTLSLRRATALALYSCGGASDFYPRSPCGERLVTVGLLMFNLYFYPRSPCGERLTCKETGITP